MFVAGWPPQTIISLPVQTAGVCVATTRRAGGRTDRSPGVADRIVARTVLRVAPHEPSRQPPQTIISEPVQTALCHSRALGAFTKLVSVQVFVVGLKRPPVIEGPKPVTPPPQ